MSIGSRTVIRQDFSNNRTTDPTVEPVAVEEIKRHPLRISNDDHDETLEDLIRQAREHIEEVTGLAMIQQTWTMTMDRWPPGTAADWWDGTREGHIDMLYGSASGHGTVVIPRYPLISVDSVTVYDESNNSTAVTVATTFDVDTTSKRGRISLQAGKTWPVALRANKAVEIVYKAGYGTAPSNVPVPLRGAVRDMAAEMFDGCTPAKALENVMPMIDAYRAINI